MVNALQPFIITKWQGFDKSYLSWLNHPTIQCVRNHHGSLYITAPFIHTVCVSHQYIHVFTMALLHRWWQEASKCIIPCTKLWSYNNMQSIKFPYSKNPLLFHYVFFKKRFYPERFHMAKEITFQFLRKPHEFLSKE